MELPLKMEFAVFRVSRSSTEFVKAQEHRDQEFYRRPRASTSAAPSLNTANISRETSVSSA